jgi:hypothetical protein
MEFYAVLREKRNGAKNNVLRTLSKYVIVSFKFFQYAKSIFMMIFRHVIRAFDS